MLAVQLDQFFGSRMSGSEVGFSDNNRNIALAKRLAAASWLRCYDRLSVDQPSPDPFRH